MRPARSIDTRVFLRHHDLPCARGNPRVQRGRSALCWWGSGVTSYNRSSENLTNPSYRLTWGKVPTGVAYSYEVNRVLVLKGKPDFNTKILIDTTFDPVRTLTDQNNIKNSETYIYLVNARVFKEGQFSPGAQCTAPGPTSNCFTRNYNQTKPISPK